MFNKVKKLQFRLVALILLCVLFSVVGQIRPFTISTKETDENRAGLATSSSASTLSIYKENPETELPIRNPVHLAANTKALSKPGRGGNRYCDKRNNGGGNYCIFDIGLNRGQDTMQYLQSSPASRVVAIEASPKLVDDAKEKFSDAVNEGRLKLINIGLVGNATEPRERREKLSFWVNTERDEYSSFKQTTGCRSPEGHFLAEGDTTFCRRLEIETMSCSELIQQFGTPRYMKVDIEGMDRACLQSLGNIPKQDRPKYISKENVWVYDIGLLTLLGYEKFKVVNQAALQVGLYRDERRGHSGPWGEDAEDLWIGKKWHSRKEILSRIPLPEEVMVAGKKRKGWYDVHARK